MFSVETEEISLNRGFKIDRKMVFVVEEVVLDFLCKAIFFSTLYMIVSNFTF